MTSFRQCVTFQFTHMLNRILGKSIFMRCHKWFQWDCLKMVSTQSKLMSVFVPFFLTLFNERVNWRISNRSIWKMSPNFLVQHHESIYFLIQFCSLIHSFVEWGTVGISKFFCETIFNFHNLDFHLNKHSNLLNWGIILFFVHIISLQMKVVYRI